MTHEYRASPWPTGPIAPVLVADRPGEEQTLALVRTEASPTTWGSESNMDNEIQLISGGDGLAVIGEPKAVETFLRAEGLWDVSKKFDLRRLRSLLANGSHIELDETPVPPRRPRFAQMPAHRSAQRESRMRLSLWPDAQPSVDRAFAGGGGQN